MEFSSSAAITQLPPGTHHVQGERGLYLKVSKDGQVRRWVFRYTSPVTKTVTETGLDLFAHVTMNQAKVKAQNLRRQVSNGICPNTAKRIERANQTTFEQCCRDWIKTHKPSWRSESMTKNCNVLLMLHGKPLLHRPVKSITAHMVEKALSHLWQTHPAQARRALNMWERVFDYAIAKELYAGNNPAAWKSCHQYRFPTRKATDKQHFAAMDYAALPGFIKQLRLRQERATGAVALEFLILTCARTGEVLNATWDEIDFEKRLWSIPAEKTKQGRAHIVPLSDRAVELLQHQLQYRDGSDYVFTGYKGTKLADKAMTMLLRNMKVDCTIHGFRSSFRDWAGDCTEFAREHVEACLAHAVGSQVELAYRRLTALQKRRAIMDAWAEYCG
ncbi:tyrosine-type recombinase/integrase [Rhizobium jaguaris]|uniref:tyrosine-type recombinase/integrase n=1 Tax=Rhizobium jaguaris TaxID=1312183 RepID=UPI0039BF0037